MTPYQRKQLDLMRQMEHQLSMGIDASTIVPFQADYTTDSQMCLSAISFIPNDIAASIQSKLIDPLRALDPNQYYYQTASLHSTFHSIRVIHNPPTYTAKDIDISKQLLSKYVPLERPFPFVLHGLLSMPTSISIIALATPRYGTFIQSLRRTFTNAGIPDDKHYFTDKIVFANTTICRYTHRPTDAFLTEVSKLKDISIGNFVAKEISLVETNAGASPAKTTVLGTYRFGQI